MDGERNKCPGSDGGLDICEIGRQTADLLGEVVDLHAKLKGGKNDR